MNPFLLKQLEASAWLRQLFQRFDGTREDAPVSLAIGNPHMIPPAAFYAALDRQLRQPTETLHHYTPQEGLADSREQIAAHLRASCQTKFRAEDIFLTMGASGALAILLKTLFAPDDEVLLLAPYFLEYPTYLALYSLRPKIVQTDAHFHLDLDAIAQAITPQTRGLILNSPNNPTGVIYTRQELTALGALLSEKSRTFSHPIYLLSDEPYRYINLTQQDIPFLSDLYDQSVLITSFSKQLAIPGERIGYLALSPSFHEHEQVRQGLNLAQRLLGFINAPSLMQAVVCELLDVTIDLAMILENKALLEDTLRRNHLDFVEPEGAFYTFVRSPLADDVAFCALARESGVLLMPGSAFGARGWFRACLCTSTPIMRAALPRLQKAIALAHAAENKPR